jgi:hypothetical protein
MTEQTGALNVMILWFWLSEGWTLLVPVAMVTVGRNWLEDSYEED